MNVVGNKERLKKMNDYLIKNIETLTSLEVFEDSIGESTLKRIEDETDGKNYFIYETGGFSKSPNKNELRQVVLLRFYSERRDDLDEISLDIIDELEGSLYEFQYSNKNSIQLGKEDKYVDEIEFFFLRKLMRNGC